MLREIVALRMPLRQAVPMARVLPQLLEARGLALCRRSMCSRVVAVVAFAVCHAHAYRRDPTLALFCPPQLQDRT